MYLFISKAMSLRFVYNYIECLYRLQSFCPMWISCLSSQMKCIFLVISNTSLHVKSQSIPLQYVQKKRCCDGVLDLILKSLIPYKAHRWETDPHQSGKPLLTEKANKTWTRERPSCVCLLSSAIQVCSTVLSRIVRVCMNSVQLWKKLSTRLILISSKNTLSCGFLSSYSYNIQLSF